MTRKIIIVAVVVWMISVIGGGAWGRLERYWRMRSIPPGQAEVAALEELYGAKLFDEVLNECDRADRNERYAAYEPQIRYIRWATDRRLGLIDQADRVQQAFLNQFPDHVLGVDMHFSTAMNFLAAGDYKNAINELEIIHARYGGSSVAGKADDILNRLRWVSPIAPSTQSS